MVIYSFKAQKVAITRAIGGPRVSSNNGASFGSAIRLTTNTGQSKYPSVAASGSNTYVAWEDDTPVLGSGTMPEIWLRVGSTTA